MSSLVSEVVQDAGDHQLKIHDNDAMQLSCRIAGDIPVLDSVEQDRRR
jgi:hypothetical protein